MKTLFVNSDDGKILAARETASDWEICVPDVITVITIRPEDLIGSSLIYELAFVQLPKQGGE